MNLLKIKSTHPESQGPYVHIEEKDFDKDTHTIYVESDAAADAKKAEDKAAKEAEKKAAADAKKTKVA